MRLDVCEVFPEPLREPHHHVVFFVALAVFARFEAADGRLYGCADERGVQPGEVSALAIHVDADFWLARVVIVVQVHESRHILDLAFDLEGQLGQGFEIVAADLDIDGRPGRRAHLLFFLHANFRARALAGQLSDTVQDFAWGYFAVRSFGKLMLIRF